MNKTENITGIILAGGKSSRMGNNKALLTINEKTIIEHLIDKLDYFFDNIYIITNTPKEFEFTGKHIFEDYFPGFGPLAGIHSGLKNSTTEKNFIISCDLPLFSLEAINFLLNFVSDKDVILFKEKNHYQPLCGIYNKEVYKTAESLLSNVNHTEIINSKIKLKLSKLLEEVSTEGICIDNLPFYFSELFFNMNSFEDFKKIKKLFNS